MTRIRRISLKSKKYIPISGSSPGSIQLYEGALKPRITTILLNQMNIILRQLIPVKK
jgi:magnesium transporter